MDSPIDPVVLKKGRYNVLIVELGYDISTEAFSSEIRAEPGGDLIATWTSAFETDGTDGRLRLYLAADALNNAEARTAKMDVKRVSGGIPTDVFDEPYPVVIREVVTQ